MKKRITAFALVLIMMLGMVPTASASKFYTNYASYGGPNVIINQYHLNMGIYDYAINTNSQDPVFTDPHEAWDDYLANKRGNNWFGTYFAWCEESDGRDFSRRTWQPTNVTQDWDSVAKWWEMMDSYIDIVHPDGHVVDPNKTTTNGVFHDDKDWTEKEITWATWTSIQCAAKDNKFPELAPWMHFSYQEWENYYNGMSKDEKTLFWEYWNKLVGDLNKEIWGTGITFDQWKESKTANNQPTDVSTQAETPTTTLPPNVYRPSKITTTAYVNTQTVNIDGNPVEFQCYALKDENGYLTNYVKLRDLAFSLVGTKAEFGATWKDNNVRIWTSILYKPNGSEMHTPFSGDRTCEFKPQSFVLVDGTDQFIDSILLTDDNGGGYTYYKVRDLGEKLGFNVGWSADRGMFIETDKGYDPNN